MSATTDKTEDELIESALAALDTPPPEPPQPEPPQPEEPLEPPEPLDLQEPPEPSGSVSMDDMPSVPSPTLEALEETRRPKQKTLCETCPNAVWFTSPSEVKCYCRVMYLVIWSSKEPNQITGCDGIYIGQE